MANIHPSAFIHPKAQLADDVEVGPFAYIGESVKIGARTKIMHHACVEGNTTLGVENEVGSFSVIGGKPQDLKYKGEPTQLIIGDRNQFREYVTINTGTVTGGGITRVGNNCLIMAYCHVAHDCTLENNVVMANSAALSGHVTLEDYVILSGMVGVAQFCRVGKFSFVAGNAAVRKDLAPYVIGMGDPLQVRGLNLVGLQRRGFEGDRMKAVKEAYKIYFDSGKEKAEAVAELEKNYSSNEDIAYFVRFVNSSKQGVSR